MTLWLALVACKGGDDGSGFALDPFEDAHIGQSVELASAVGFGELTVPVRVVNAFGASVGGNAVTVQIDGDLLGSSSETITPDALGLGQVVVGAGAPQAVTLSVSGSDYESGPAVDSYLIGPGRDLDLLPSFSLSAPPSAIAAAQGGVGLAVANEVWWQPSVPGSPAQRVLSVPSDLVGAWGSDLDQDGTPDMVTWNAEGVYLLRGHGSGGFAWGAGFAPANGTITWVSVGDVDDNGVRDLVVSYEAGGMTGVAAMLNDGLWRFTARSNLELSIDIVSVAVGRFTPEGASGLVVHTSDGELKRYGWIDGRWVSQGQDLSVRLSNGQLAPARDLNGDLVDEVVLAAPDDGTGADRDLLLIDMNDGPRTYALSYADFHLAHADLTGDLIDDLVMVDIASDGPRLGVITRSDDGGFNHRTLSLLRASGPVAAGRLEGDDLLADVAVALDDLHLFPGSENESGWTLAEPSHTSWATDALAPIRFGDWDADGVPEILTVRERDEGASLTRLAFSYDPHSGELGLIHQDSVPVDDLDDSAQASGLDMAICGDRIFLLVEDGGQSALHEVELQAEGYLDGLASLPLEAESLVACGSFGDGPVVVSDTSGSASWYDLELSDVAQATDDLGAVGDLAGYDPGDGAELASCADEGCSLWVVDLDGDGDQELVEGGGALTVHAWGESWTTDVAGAAGAVDIDGDGRRDPAVTATEHGDLAVWATVSGGLGPVLKYRWDRELAGPIRFIDIDQDGEVELAAEGVNGSVVHTPVD